MPELVSKEPLRSFRQYVGPAMKELLWDPVRLRDATDRYALHLITSGIKYNTARRYAAEVLRLLGARRPVGRPAGVKDVWEDR